MIQNLFKNKIQPNCDCPDGTYDTEMTICPSNYSKI